MIIFDYIGLISQDIGVITKKRLGKYKVVSTSELWMLVY